MVLFGLEDKGSVNASLPVIEILKKRGVPVSVFARSPAYEVLKDKFDLASESEVYRLLDSVRPLTVVATTAQKGALGPIDLTRKAKSRNLPVVVIEDVWASHSAFIWDDLPDSICVMDEFAKSMVLRSWPNYPSSQVYITGSPVFDKFVSVDTELAKNKLRKSLGLSRDWPVVFFPGQVWGMAHGVPMFIEALNNLATPIYLILRDHPTFTLPISRSDEYIEIYLTYQEALEHLKWGTIVDSSNLTSDEVNAGSDTVVGLYSTMTVEACYMHKPVLIISTSEINQTLLEATNNTLSIWPLVDLRTALKAGSVGEIEDCLYKIFDGDTAEMCQAQQKHFKADGLSGRRVAEVILNYYQ